MESRPFRQRYGFRTHHTNWSLGPLAVVTSKEIPASVQDGFGVLKLAFQGKQAKIFGAGYEEKIEGEQCEISFISVAFGEQQAISGQVIVLEWAARSC